jgi:guanylate kinase
MKPIIFCIVGESGSGKTMIAEALEKYGNIPMIQSYTDRPRRTPNENGHTFLEKADFDLLRQEEMIAFTEWNGSRYCCLKSDVKPVNTYVIDCKGLEYLKANFSGVYDIYAIRIKRWKAHRIKSVGSERVRRDEGKFYLPNYYFDAVFHNISGVKLDVISNVWVYCQYVLLRP